ncbi:unnamed protein product, partial [Phaeothamnion confervicola]
WYLPFETLVSAVDATGETALDLARRVGHADVAALLEDASNRVAEWHARAAVIGRAAERVDCPLGCGKPCRRDRLEGHVIGHCRLRRVPCPGNSGYGSCGAMVVAEAVARHMLSECPKRSVPCPNWGFGCTSHFPAHAANVHALHRCPYRRLPCRRGCGAIVAAREREPHESDTCPLSVHPCPRGCGAAAVERRAAGAHAAACPRRPARCRFGCGRCMPHEELDVHYETVCRRPCRWPGCGVRVAPAAKLDAHERLTCPFRPVSCPHAGCPNGPMPAKTLEEHAMQRCAARPTACPRGCGAVLKAAAVAAHVVAESGDCPERLMRCRLDCLHRRIVVSTSDCSAEAVPVVERTAAPGSVSLPPESFSEVSLPLPSTAVTASIVTVARAAEPADEGLKVENASEDATQTAEAMRLPGMEMALLQEYDDVSGAFLISYPHRVVWQRLAGFGIIYGSAVATIATISAADAAAGWRCGWIPASAMAVHLAGACPLRRGPCKAGCGQHVVAADAERHFRDRCVKRTVACALGCGKRLPADTAEEHAARQCPLREVPCD